MLIHKCFICKNATEMWGPASMLAGNSVMLCFFCNVAPVVNIGSNITAGHNIIYDLVSELCWLDGGPTIPVDGCNLFERRSTINVEVEECINNHISKLQNMKSLFVKQSGSNVA